MVTPTRTVRIEPELEAAAPSHLGLADVSPSCLVRVALRVLVTSTTSASLSPACGACTATEVIAGSPHTRARRQQRRAEVMTPGLVPGALLASSVLAGTFALQLAMLHVEWPS